MFEREDFLNLLKFYTVLISISLRWLPQGSKIFPEKKIAILKFANRASKIVKIAEPKFSNEQVFIETVGLKNTK